MSDLNCQPVKKWRIIRLQGGYDLSAEAGGGSHSFDNTYAVPDDGRDLMELTLGELKAYPATSALALLDRIVSKHPLTNGDTSVDE